ncbi:uncharacterized protein BYT42DRAFT_289604 [Radiomyces spectabilis]|uniref:uncharacterized protein n=1 Tax=Radiomyces spectabilis TaxID=64574 RepID=UPI00221E769B|nr:uncharacterized protein BYT42DRAFT_289604 [Radiomyces spectabilis]KAI8381032.1 hypothetical protein BYT42DRAFT_289604 [Radiomyces spectabilis]
MPMTNSCFEKRITLDTGLKEPTVDSWLHTYLKRQDEFPSDRIESLPEPAPVEDAAQLPAKRSLRHLFAASTSELTAFISRDGYWSSICVGLGLEAGKSEIISIDVVEEHRHDKIRFMLAVAVAEKADTDNDDTGLSFSLRIYGHDIFAKPYLEQTLFELEKSCQVIPLLHAPMQICHTSIKDAEGNNQTAFLLSSNEGVIHMYIQDPQQLIFREISTASYFPILNRVSDLRIKILFTHIYDRANGQRVICTAGQNGEIFLGFYDQDGHEMKSHAIQMFTPISSVVIFQPRVSKKVREDDGLHLVITCAIEQAVVYRSIETNGLSRGRILPQSNLYDSVLCSHVMDVDWDGEMEILIGTYGRQVLIYKQVAGTQDYNVLWRRQFAYPIYRMTHLDLNRDGLDELIVITMYGVHIFQPNMKKTKDRLLKVLQFVESSKRQKYELLLELQHQKEMEKAIVFESS